MSCSNQSTCNFCDSLVSSDCLDYPLPKSVTYSTPKTWTSSFLEISSIKAQERVKNAHMGGAFALGNEFFYIKKVIYNYPATIVFWSDGTKTVSKCLDTDTYSEEAGLSVCVLKKLSSGGAVRKLMEDWLPGQYYEGNTYGNAVVEVKDVRAKHKAIEDD